MIYICNVHVLSNLLLIYICKLHWNLNTMFVYAGELLLIYICNFHVLNHLLLIYICKLQRLNGITIEDILDAAYLSCLSNQRVTTPEDIASDDDYDSDNATGVNSVNEYTGVPESELLKLKKGRRRKTR